MALAEAFALDSVSALAAAPMVKLVVVVAGDRDAVATFGSFGNVHVTVDRQAGMNEAVTQGIRWALAHLPDAAVAVIPADVPAATAELFGTFLTRAGRHPRSVLPDMEMVGTTGLTALPGNRLRPRFGPRSLREHLRSGAVLVDTDGLDPLRRDVDLAEHLDVALGLGVGRATRDVMAAGA